MDNQEDVALIKELTSSLRPGGLWGYRNCPVVFKKESERVFGLVNAPPSAARVVEKTTRLMAAIGITVVDRREAHQAS